MAPDQGLNLTYLGMPSGLADLQCNCIFSKENSEKRVFHTEGWRTF